MSKCVSAGVKECVDINTCIKVSKPRKIFKFCKKILLWFKLTFEQQPEKYINYNHQSATRSIFYRTAPVFFVVLNLSRKIHQVLVSFGSRKNIVLTNDEAVLQYSLTHSVTQSLSHSVTHLLSHSPTQSLSHLLPYLLTYSFTNSHLTHPLMC